MQLKVFKKKNKYFHYTHHRYVVDDSHFGWRLPVRKLSPIA